MNARAQTPELAKHLRAIGEGNRIDREWMSDERFDEIAFICDVGRRHLNISIEAAGLRDQTLLHTHLRHGREALVLAIKIFNMLPSKGGE